MDLSMKEIELRYKKNIISHANYVDEISKIYKPAINIIWTHHAYEFIQDASAIELNVYCNLMMGASLPIVQTAVLQGYIDNRIGDIDSLNILFQLGVNGVMDNYYPSYNLHNATMKRNKEYKKFYNNLCNEDKEEIEKAQKINKGKMFDTLEEWRINRLANLIFLSDFLVLMDTVSNRKEINMGELLFSEEEKKFIESTFLKNQAKYVGFTSIYNFVMKLSQGIVTKDDIVAAIPEIDKMKVPQFIVDKMAFGSEAQKLNSDLDKIITILKLKV